MDINLTCQDKTTYVYNAANASNTYKDSTWRELGKYLLGGSEGAEIVIVEELHSPKLFRQAASAVPPRAIVPSHQYLSHGWSAQKSGNV